MATFCVSCSGQSDDRSSNATLSAVPGQSVAVPDRGQVDTAPSSNSASAASESADSIAYVPCQDIGTLRNDAHDAWASAGWTVSAEHNLHIGTANSGGPTDFSEVRDAAQLAGSSHIAVLERPSNEIRIFTSDGRFVSTVGRTGNGPGEFRIPQLVPVASRFDSIVIVDFSLRRVTAFTTNGILLSTRRIDTPTGGAVGIDGSGSVVVVRNPLPPGPAATGIAYQTSTVDVVDFAGDTTVVRTLLRDSIQTIRILSPSPRGGTAVQGGAWVPFRVYPTAAVGRHSIFATAGKTADIRRFGASGCLEQVISIAGALRPIPAGEYDRWIEWGLSRVSDKVKARAMYAEIPRAEALPAWQNLLVDEEGLLWAEVFRPMDDSTTNKWMVFKPNGRAIGTVDLPPLLEVLQIGRDFVLGRWTDSDRLEYVRRYSLRRQAR